MKTKLGIVGCGFLGNIVADAWKNGLLPEFELVGVTSRTRASAEATAAKTGCAVCDTVDALLALEPEYIVEAASVEAVRAMALPVLRRGVNLVILSIGAFADLAFYEQVQQAAREGSAKVHLASGAIGGFDVLQTVTLMAQARQVLLQLHSSTSAACAVSVTAVPPSATSTAALWSTSAVLPVPMCWLSAMKCVPS